MRGRGGAGHSHFAQAAGCGARTPTGGKGNEAAFQADAKKNTTVFLKQFENFINHQSLVKNKLESSEVIFFLYSKQVPVVYIYRVLEGWGSTLLRASLWLEYVHVF